MSLHGVFAMAAGFGTGAGGNPRTTDTDSGLSDDWMSVRARYSSRKKGYSCVGATCWFCRRKRRSLFGRSFWQSKHFDVPKTHIVRRRSRTDLVDPTNYSTV